MNIHITSSDYLTQLSVALLHVYRYVCIRNALLSLHILPQPQCAHDAMPWKWLLEQISAKKIGPSHFFNPAVNEKNHLKVDFYSLRRNKMCKKFKKVIFWIIARYFIKLTLLLLLEVCEGKINCFNNWSLMLLALSLNFDKPSLFYQQILSRLKFCSWLMKGEDIKQDIHYTRKTVRTGSQPRFLVSL